MRRGENMEEMESMESMESMDRMESREELAEEKRGMSDVADMLRLDPW